MLPSCLAEVRVIAGADSASFVPSLLSAAVIPGATEQRPAPHKAL
jgi:hypothetical protein